MGTDPGTTPTEEKEAVLALLHAELRSRLIVPLHYPIPGDQTDAE